MKTEKKKRHQAFLGFPGKQQSCTAGHSKPFQVFHHTESGMKTRTSIWISSPLLNEQECSENKQKQPNRSLFPLEMAGPFSYPCSSF